VSGDLRIPDAGFATRDENAPHGHGVTQRRAVQKQDFDHTSEMELFEVDIASLLL
jgi:hypothetical protein